MTDNSARSHLIAKVSVPEESVLDTTSLMRGIDNYHIDVHLSDEFVLLARELIGKVVKRAAAGEKPMPGSDDIEEFREVYRDLMTTSLHRTKWDFTARELLILQFAIVKFLLREVREALQDVLRGLEDTVAQQQNAGSRSLLNTQERLATFRKHHDIYLYRANRAILQQVQREENGLRQLRKQFSPKGASEIFNVMFNPMLCSESPIDVTMLAECYALWPGGGREFAAINLRLEDTLTEAFPELLVNPLKNAAKIESAEVFDTLHGLFSSQDILGPSEDQSSRLTESYCWLEQPANVRLLFDADVQERELKAIREASGIKGQWDLKSDLKKIRKLLGDLKTKLFDEMAFKEAIACYQLRESWTVRDQQMLDIRVASAYVAGNESKKILSKLDMSQEGLANLLNRLDGVAESLPKLLKEEADEYFLKILGDLFRFRLHLKYFRFAHRVFNRLKVVTEQEEIQLAKSGGQLYELLRRDEIKEQQDDEAKIVRHVILKVEIRGSNTLIRELTKRELNPASYFSLRFFGPINERLVLYGAEKVSIQGDSLVLGFYEYDQEPDHWFAVARACGLAKEILDVVSSKNAHSAKSGLPSLEVGIGICYEPEMPLFLLDGERPILISTAIADADRSAACSWRLRGVHEGLFNVDVVETEDLQVGEKGEKQLQYNVNGIVLARAGFQKIKAEISLRKLKLKLGATTETMYIGKFPDMQGKERDLVIREGRIGVLEAGAIAPERPGEVYYEILPNTKLSRQVLELSRQ